MFGRLFDKKKPGEDAAPHAAPGPEPAGERATIGLCFNFERGLIYESEYLSDVGTKMILGTLKDLKLRATFNCPAKLCDIAPDHLATIAAAGHEIAVLGFADESPRELTDDAVKQLVFSCRSAFARRGYKPVGFRAPNSHWDERLIRELAKQEFKYNSEHDHAKQPYRVLPDVPIVRIPVYTDDRGLRRSTDTHDMTVSKHFRVQRKAFSGRYFASIVFHPWILAEDMERMEHWQSWVRAAVNAGAKVCALEDAVPPELLA